MICRDSDSCPPALVGAVGWGFRVVDAARSGQEQAEKAVLLLLPSSPQRGSAGQGPHSGRGRGACYDEARPAWLLLKEQRTPRVAAFISNSRPLRAQYGAWAPRPPRRWPSAVSVLDHAGPRGPVLDVCADPGRTAQGAPATPDGVHGRLNRRILRRYEAESTCLDGQSGICAVTSSLGRQGLCYIYLSARPTTPGTWTHSRTRLVASLPWAYHGRPRKKFSPPDTT